MTGYNVAISKGFVMKISMPSNASIFIRDYTIIIINIIVSIITIIDV